MVAQNFRHALFCAVITLIIAWPIMGLKLTAEGTDITVTGADAFTWIAVAVAAAIVFAFQLFRDHIMGNLSGVAALNPLANREPLPDEKRLRLENIGLVLLIAIALVWPFFVSRGAVDLATLVLIYIMLALGLNVVVGLAGLLDLGYVAFYAVGAYTFALLSNYWGVSFWMALPVGACWPHCSALCWASRFCDCGGLPGHCHPGVW